MSISPFHIEIDKIDRKSWDHLIAQFDDASISQTWSDGTIARGKKSVSHIVIKKGEDILGCCQVRLRRLPLYNLGIADIIWGPLCIKKGGMFSPDVLYHMMRALKEEYAIKRGYLLRISPHAKGESKELFKQILENEGFIRNQSLRPYRTFILDLSPPLEDLHKNFLPKWRGHLNKAERSELKVVEGTNDDLYKIFLMLAKEMVERKNLTTEHINIFEHYGRIQADLPESLKMKIMICEAENEPVCATICSAIGDTGIYLLGATGEKALKLNGAYLLQWRMIQWMKGIGIHYYDLGAFNPKLNPGVYNFKQGIAGKKGWDETFIGEYHGCFNLTGRMVKFLLDCLKFLRVISRKQNTI